HEGIPPTPSSGDHFLRPMVQRQDFGVPHFNGAPAPGSLAPTTPSDFGSDTGLHDGSHYSGLPEPQENAASGPTMDMPTPRYNSSHPRPLPMTVEHVQQAQTPIARPPRVNLVPYAENDNSRPGGWTAPTGNEWESPPQVRNASPLHASQPGSSVGVRRLPPIHQSSSHVANLPLGSPSRSPPLPEIYGGIAVDRGGGGGGESPVRTLPPIPEGKGTYVPYQ
ncbi:hypothetical protein FRC06_005712, partial [Ceratobasidium sp. 370]